MKTKFLMITFLLFFLSFNSFAMYSVTFNFFAEGNNGWQTPWGDVGWGGCRDGYGLCIGPISNGGNEDDDNNDYCEINIEKLEIKLKINVSHKEDFMKLVTDNKLILKNDSGLSNELLKTLGVTKNDNKYYYLEKGDYKFVLKNGFYYVDATINFKTKKS